MAKQLPKIRLSMNPESIESQLSDQGYVLLRADLTLVTGLLEASELLRRYGIITDKGALRASGNIAALICECVKPKETK